MQMTKSMHLSKKQPITMPTASANTNTVSNNNNMTTLLTDKTKKKKKPTTKKANDLDEDATVANMHHHPSAPHQHHAPPPPPPTTTTTHDHLSTSSKRKKKKKTTSPVNKSPSRPDHTSSGAAAAAAVAAAATSSSSHWLRGSKSSGDAFWSSMSNSEERQKIREFWLQLSEDERRSLVKVEKEAVLKKMKEQQKHTCNCSVCGKKRTAIEDELEVLYDAYYEELEQYANHQRQTGIYGPSPEQAAAVAAVTAVAYNSNGAFANGYGPPHHLDDDDDDDDDGDDEEEDYDDDEDEDDDEDDASVQSDDISDGDHSSCDDGSTSYPAQISTTASNKDYLSFGNSLQVKGGILTVADDLLQNDGRKFLDMMEKLAERRLQKEEEVSEQAEEYLDEVDEDEDEVYEDEEEEDTRTEEQRMEEGRRMFQIFAARMFEQRVLAAYREKVAQERQQRLLQELEEEDRLRQERELKKQKEKERKKDKKRQLKKQKEEERMALEAKRKAEEEAAKAERERKLEEERQKREQERLRKEEERRQREEERIRKEEEKRRRLKEERERAAEKEKKRKEKEEKEQRDREERERIEREKKEALAAKEKAEQDERRAKEQELARQEKAKADMGKSSSPLPTTTTPMRPAIDEAARQKTLMDALVGAPASSSSSSSSPQPLLNRTSLLSAGIANIPHSMPGDIKPLGMDMPQPPHPLFPPHPFAARDIPPPIGPVRQGEPATSPTRGYAPLGDRGMLPIGHGRLSSSFDAGRTVARPGAQIAPIGQPVNGRRPSTTAGPVGSPMGSRTNWLNSTDDGSSKRSPLATSDAENSFFSNFLFGDHGRDMSLMHPELATSRLQERRFSLESAGVGWTNGWTASTALSDNVHGKLFGDVLCDRTTTILERARTAYHKLDEITQAKYFMSPPQFYTLVQLHRMMCDMYYDTQVDIQELYEVINTPGSGFQCISHAHHGYIVRYDRPLGMSSNSPIHPPHLTSPPLAPPLATPLATASSSNTQQQPPTQAQQQLKGNQQLFGGL
ncbi:hypothetical protein K492DRAFT_204367 [Lichtheimia hyalospora FSU 10163]|nr:hypothetical protein K492DRAFT_204367 [Lichtheimia hyalospora FSU 10163]